MSELIRKNFSGTMNTDDDPSGKPLFPANDYLDSENTRFAGRDGKLSLRRVSVKGNILKANPLLPAGENTAIGCFEYKKKYSIIIFNHNSEGDHAIFMYAQNSGVWTKLAKSEFLRFEKQRKITSVHMVNDQILYWVDGKELFSGEISGTSPKMLDIIKADNTGKNKIYNIYFDTDFITAGNTYTLTFGVYVDGVETEIAGIGITIGTGTVKEEYDAIAVLLNAAMTTVNFVSFGNYIQATLTLVGSGELVGVGITPIFLPPFFTFISMLVVADNCYPETGIEDYFERIKFPALCHPTCTPSYDSAFGQNLIKRKWFQFAVQYVYHNSERTVLSPYSEIIFPLAPCGVDEDTIQYNYIDVDFTDTRLNNAAVLSTLKKVRLYMRADESQKFRFVKELERQEFGIVANKFRFYNDGNYPIAPDDILTIQDEVPEIAVSETFVNATGYLGGCVEGKDNIPTDGNVTVTYEDDECIQPENGTVTGRITFLNRLADAADAETQPIHDWGEGPYFGGMTVGADIFAEGITDYEQSLDLRGIIVYLAGTDYYGKSIQHNPGFGVEIAAGEGNVFLSDTVGQRNAIRDAMAAKEVYSEYTISAPPGKYIMRVASHKLSEDGAGAYRFPGDGYQNTSTNVHRFVGSVLIHEAVIEITAGGTYNQDIEINDLIAVNNTQESSVVCGYLLDAGASSEQDDLLTGARMERQKIETNVSTDVQSFIGSGSGIGYTDHNGYFFFARKNLVGIETDWKFTVKGVNGLLVKAETESFYRGDLNDLEEGTMTDEGAEITVGNFSRSLILYNKTENTGIKTKVQGVVMNGADVAPGMKIITSLTNRVVYTDGGGAFSVLVYGDAITNTRTVTLILTHDGACCTEYPDGQQYDYTISPFITDNVYSDEFPFDAGILNILIEGLANELRHKKRNLVELYCQYGDGAGRVSRAMFLGKVYIPFPTEEGGNLGKPVVHVEINHVPPIWAKTIQLLRKKNSYYNRYTQHIVGEVQYVKYYDTTALVPEAITTSFDAGDATEIFLSLLPDVQYAQENNGSIIGFLPEQGDRVTLMKDAEDNWLPYFDFKIENYKGLLGSGTDPVNIIIKNNTLLPELFEGTLVETYTPKLRLEEDVVFEFGECFYIVDPGTEDRRHPAMSGGVEQVVGVQPATGILTSGDCFFRKRNMVIQSGGSKTYFLRAVEDEYMFDNDITSKVQSVGRPNYEDKEFSRTYYKTRIRYDLGFLASGIKVYNGHSNFRISDFIDLDVSFGAITALLRIGDSAEILSIHKHKNQSLYTKRTPLVSVDGNNQVAKDNSPLTLGTSFEENWGTQHPESIIQEGNQIWAFDLFMGVFWFYSSGGLIPISDKYKIRKQVKEIRDALLVHDLDKVFIYGAMDRNNEELVWSFAEVLATDEVVIGGGDDGGGGDPDDDGTGGMGLRGIGDLPADFSPVTLAFTLRRNGWETRYGYFPEWMVSIGKNDFYAFSAGELWHQYVNPVACNFFGVQKRASIKFVINEFPVILDYLFAIITGNKAWKFTIEILPTETFPNGMTSRITVNNFVHNEGVWSADFLKDMTDPNFESELEALFRGRDLKGGEMIITAETKETIVVHTSEFAFGVIVSPETY